MLHNAGNFGLGSEAAPHEATAGNCSYRRRGAYHCGRIRRPVGPARHCTEQCRGLRLTRADADAAR